MSRKIHPELIDRLIKGDLMPLLNYLKTDSDLRLEVRRNGEAFIYYRKGVALEVRKMKVNTKYGNVPPTDLAISNPSLYFKSIKQCISGWLDSGKGRPEFDTQQKIAQCNQGVNDKYIIIDMEYAFERNKIEAELREKGATFDLLGIERETGKIVFFEVKRGLSAIKGKSGIDKHLNDFKAYLHGNNQFFFKNNLIRDIDNIVKDKITLGLISNFEFQLNLEDVQPEQIFVFHPSNHSEIEVFKRELQGQAKLILVSDDDYKLREIEATIL